MAFQLSAFQQSGWQTGLSIPVHPPSIFGGFGFSVQYRARIIAPRLHLYTLPIKAKLFTVKSRRKIKLAVSDTRPVLLAKVTPQPLLKITAFCQPRFDKSAVIARRNAQIEKMLNAAHVHMLEEFARHVGSL